MSESVRDIVDLVEKSQIRFLRLGWVDNAGVYRVHAVRAHRIAQMVEEGLGLATGAQAVPVHEDVVAEGLPIGPVGQVWLVPDARSFRPLPWEREHGAVMGSFVTQDGAPWAYCPRGVLQRQIDRLADVGLSMQAAFEHEFMLLREREGALMHFESSHYASTHGLDAAGPLLDEMARDLEEQGVAVESMLKEAGLSQFEIVTEHGSPLLAADQFVTVRETISAVAMRHDLIGTCLPLVFEEEAGNGWHLHFSLFKGSKNLTSDGPVLGELSASFLAGILEHLPGLCALTTPTPNSFRRIRPAAWAGAYRVWGYDNKEAALRVPSARKGGPTNIELKVADASSNPYLALAAVVGAGLDGIERGLTLPDPVTEDVGSLSEEERVGRGIEALPSLLSQALVHLRSDDVLLEVLGPQLAEAYIKVKESEVAHFEGGALEEEVQQLVAAY
ncbi:MAG: glutamine synthetase family protein [Myxococcota bacterium]|nr:glutamine synthetase family protein [Myxococcota bacterium]